MQITGRETLWQGNFLKTIRITYLDNKGVMRDWEAVDRTGADGVVIIVPFTGAREFVLVRQFRVVIGNYALSPAFWELKRKSARDFSGTLMTSISSDSSPGKRALMSSVTWRAPLAMTAVQTSAFDPVDMTFSASME